MKEMNEQEYLNARDDLVRRQERLKLLVEDIARDRERLKQVEKELVDAQKTAKSTLFYNSSGPASFIKSLSKVCSRSINELINLGDECSKARDRVKKLEQEATAEQRQKFFIADHYDLKFCNTFSSN